MICQCLWRKSQNIDACALHLCIGNTGTNCENVKLLCRGNLSESRNIFTANDNFPLLFNSFSIEEGMLSNELIIKSFQKENEGIAHSHPVFSSFVTWWVLEFNFLIEGYVSDSSSFLRCWWHLNVILWFESTHYHYHFYFATREWIPHSLSLHLG